MRSTVTITDDEPNKVTQCKNAETVYSEQLKSHPLSLNRRRKSVPSEGCSENPAAVAATGIKKPQKHTAGHVPKEWFSFNIDEDDLETLKKGDCTEWAMKNFEIWCIARNAKLRLHEKGVGSETKNTPVLTQLEEDKLWESGVLSLNTPIGLLRSVFFYNGKRFCLWGDQEQHGFKLSQITKSVE